MYLQSGGTGAKSYSTDTAEEFLRWHGYQCIRIPDDDKRKKRVHYH